MTRPAKGRRNLAGTRGRQTRLDLAPQLRTNRNSHVIVCAAVELDIANFSPQTNRTSKSLHSSRVKRAIGRPIGYADCVGETGLRILIVNAEVVESTLARNEDSKYPRLRLKFRSGESVQGSEILNSPFHR